MKPGVLLSADAGSSDNLATMLDDLQQHEEGPELAEVNVKIESLAESHGMLGRLVGEHAKEIKSAHKVIIALGNTVVKLQVDNKQLMVDNKQLMVDNKQVQVDNKQLMVDNKQVLSYVGVLMAERNDNRKVMVFRQLATAYQFRAATMLNYSNRPERRFMVTHEVLRKAKSTDNNVLLKLESCFSTRDSQLTGEEIENTIKLIRGTGVGTSHPTTLLAADGSDYTPTADDLYDSPKAAASACKFIEGSTQNLIYFFISIVNLSKE
jgi:hypothetical protein